MRAQRDWAEDAERVIEAIEMLVIDGFERPECLVTPDEELAAAVAALAFSRGIGIRIVIDPGMESGKALLAMDRYLDLRDEGDDADREWN